MRIIITSLIAICCLREVAKAAPSGFGGSYHGGGGGSSSNQIPLEGTPDLETFAHIGYPKYDILDLGEYSKDHLPGDEIKITKSSKLTIPQPYPVHIPVPQPYPVPVEKPYPVIDTKIVKVPVPVPHVVEKSVPYPVEVPKPYPVPSGGDHLGGGGGGDIIHGGHQAYEGHGYAVQETNNDLPANEGYGNGGGGSSYGGYQALEEQSEAENYGQSGSWQPVDNGEGH